MALRKVFSNYIQPYIKDKSFQIIFIYKEGGEEKYENKLFIGLIPNYQHQLNNVDSKPEYS